MPAGDGVYFININAVHRKKHRLEEGSVMNISIHPDESEFGMPFPEALNEVLEQDEEGKKWFESLTPGKKRNLIYIVNKVKNVERKVEKSLIIVRHLKDNQGKIDYKVLHAELKAGLY